MVIVKAEQKDLYEILNLQYLAYQSEAKLCNNSSIPPLTQTLEDVENEFANGTFLKMTDESGAIVASVRAYAKNGTLYSGKLIVRPDLQGQGIGTQLLKEIEKVCQYERYELFTSNKSNRNIKLYERLGYMKFKEQDMGSNLKLIYLCKTNQIAEA